MGLNGNDVKSLLPELSQKRRNIVTIAGTCLNTSTRARGYNQRSFTEVSRFSEITEKGIKRKQATSLQLYRRHGATCQGQSWSFLMERSEISRILTLNGVFTAARRAITSSTLIPLHPGRATSHLSNRKSFPVTEGTQQHHYRWHLSEKSINIKAFFSLWSSANCRQRLTSLTSFLSKGFFELFNLIANGEICFYVLSKVTLLHQRNHRESK